MRIPIAISALILAAAAGLSWEIDRRLAAARSEQKKLAAEATGLGISPSDEPLARNTKRERMDRVEAARQLAAEFSREADKWESVRPSDPPDQERGREIRERLEALEPSQLRTIIVDMLASKELAERVRAERAVGLLGILAMKDPQGALALFAEHYPAIKSASRAASVISDSLGVWAKDDPLSAVEWMKGNCGELPEEIIHSSRRNVLHSVAEKDPRLSFKLAAEFDNNPMDPVLVLHAIVTAAGNNETRSITLAALREYLDLHKGDPTVGEQADRSLGYFSWGFKPDGFDAAREWVASVHLNPKELEGFCAGLSVSSEVDEPARWIEWMGELFPPGEGDKAIMDMASRWTRDDYEAAGKWLESATEGGARNAAIRGYAQTIFQHDPEVAMQWIMTLPAGKERDATLERIYQNWPKEDSAARDVFAQEYGIE